MKVTAKYKALLTLAIMSSVSHLVMAANSENKPNAPLATSTQISMPFREVPYLDNAFIDAAPYDNNDGLAVGKVEDNGVDKKAILKLAKEIANKELGNFDSLLIAHKGKLVFESYYLRGRVNLPHPQASATKGYIALVLGRAMQMGYLTMADLDKPIVSFLKELDPTKFVEGVDTITLNQALTMRGGLGIDRDTWDELKKDTAKLKGQGQVQTLFEHSAPVTKATQVFSYGNFNPTLVMQVIEAVVPGTAKEFIQTELLGKLGITNYGWQTEVSHLPTAGSRASLTSRDMMKMGKLVMQKGKWRGEQLIPEAYIAKATNTVLFPKDEEFHYGGKDTFNQGYGYYWWTADLRVGDKTYYSRSAQGGWGQFVILIDELDLIIVTTAHDNDTAYLQVAAERILPAFVN